MASLTILFCLFGNEIALHHLKRESECYCGERITSACGDEYGKSEDVQEIVPSDRVIEGVAGGITGGEITTREKFPWSVRVVFVCLGRNKKLAKWTVCTGSILSPRLVASSAHCFKERVNNTQFDSFCKKQKNKK